MPFGIVLITLANGQIMKHFVGNYLPLAKKDYPPLFKESTKIMLPLQLLKLFKPLKVYQQLH